MTMTINEAPDAGWYPDPLDDSSWRWWDGAGWSEQVRPRSTVEPVARRPLVQPAPPGVQHVESATPAPQYAPPVAAQPIVVAQPVAVEQPIVQPIPAPVVTAPPAAPTPAPQADPVAVAVESIAPSAELVTFDGAPIEHRYPWEAAIAALEAEQRAAAPTVRAATTPTPANGGTPRRTAPLALTSGSAPASANTPWIWLLAFTLYVWGVIAGALNAAALLGLSAAGMDAATVGLGAAASWVLAFIPLLVFANLDRRALARRNLQGPSALWMMLLPPYAYFLMRGRALRKQNARSVGPKIALLVVTVLLVLSVAATAVVTVMMLSSSGLI